MNRIERNSEENSWREAIDRRWKREEEREAQAAALVDWILVVIGCFALLALALWMNGRLQ